MTGIQEGMTARQVADTLMNNFSEVSAEVDSTKAMVAAEEARATAKEDALAKAIAQNVGDIKSLQSYKADKTELRTEEERAKSKEAELQSQIERNSNAIREIAEATGKKKDVVEVYSDTRTKPSSVFLNSSDGGWKLKNQYGEGLFFNVISPTGGDSNVAKIDASGNMTISGSLSQRSDETLKSVLSFVPNVTIDDIANAPICYFHWKDVEDDVQHIGTIAQYWKNIVPECVRGEEGDMTMDYATLGLVSAIVNAREIVRLRKILKEKGYDTDEE